MIAREIVDKIQEYQRKLASLECKEINIPGFTIYLHEIDTRPNSNFAIPSSPKIPNVRESLELLRRIFESNKRKPRIEFLVEYAKSLIKELPLNNFFEVMRIPLVCCLQETFQEVKPTSITIKKITSRSPLTDIRNLLMIQRECFGYSVPLDRESIIKYRESLNFKPFLAFFDGKPAAIVFLGPVYNGISEIIGLATRPSFRRQGIATTLLSEVLCEAFNEGVDVVFAGAGSEYSFRILTKIGSFQIATLVGYNYRPKI